MSELHAEQVIAPVETRYAGCHFRSRLEARWAVVFDELEIAWHYEPETYDVPGHGWYLPDFLLPGFFAQKDGVATGLLLEIKPAPPTVETVEKLATFGDNVLAGRVEGARGFALAIGSVPRDPRRRHDCRVYAMAEGLVEWMKPEWLIGTGVPVKGALKTARSYRFGEEER